MAIKINAGEVNRKDLFYVFPEEIIVVPGENGRVEPYTTEETAALAQKILKDTQLQPVQVRRVTDAKIQLVFGYGRHAAITYINTVLQPDDPIKIGCVVVDCNAEEAFLRNLSENLDRKGTNAIDDAHNQRRLREQYNWSEQRIADYYKQSVSYLAQLRKTLGLDTSIQKEVVTGNLPVQAAIDLTELPTTEHKEALDEARNPETNKINAETIRKRVRNRRIETNTGGKGRSLKELRTFFTECTGPGETEAARGLASKMIDFIAGKITDKQMTNAIAKYTKEDQPASNEAAA